MKPHDYDENPNLCPVCGDTGVVYYDDGSRRYCDCEAGYDLMRIEDGQLEDQLQMMEFEDRISGFDVEEY